MTDDLDAHRAFYAALVAANGGAKDPRIEQVFAAVRRERFLGPGPWLAHTAGGYIATPNDNPALLYQDLLFALVADRHINNGQPSLHARCLDAAAVRPGDRVLHIGSGSGYYTALLAELTGPGGSVIALEIDAALAARAAANLTPWRHARVERRCGLDTPLPENDADVIYVSAGCSYPPRQWADALAAGGRLVFPLTPDWGTGGMLLVTRADDHADDATTLRARFLCPCAFIPCVGARSSEDEKALAAAFRWGDAKQVSELRFGDDLATGTAWCAGEGWGLF